MLIKTGLAAGMLLLPASLIAQCQVKGNVADPAGKPLEFATVALYRTADSTLVKGTVSDASGHYLFKSVPNGTYYTEASFVGYRPVRSAGFQAHGAEMDIATLVLHPTEQSLQSVTVTAKKALVEQHPDRTVINVSNSVLAEGNTALEVLEKVPGVTVDDEGNITLKGKQGVTVMLNGKLTYLSQKELATLLRGTPSASISKVEILTQPSARYDAKGNGGILNIELKKNELTGFNGNAYANAAHSRKPRYGAGLNLNYRSGKINAFGSYDHAYRGEKELLSYTRRFRQSGQAEPDRVSFQHTVTDEPLYTNTFKAGLDFYADSRNTLGFVLNGNVGTYSNYGSTSNRLQKMTGALIADARSANSDESRWSSLSYNANYTRKFRKEGRQFSADLDYSGNRFQSNQLLDTRYLDEGGAYTDRRSMRRGDIPSYTWVYVGKADYVHPLGKNTKLETGWKSSYVAVNNEVKYDTLAVNAWVPDRSASNRFTYRETIHAGYVQVGGDWGAYQYQVGLRGEYTRTKGHQVTTDSLVRREYFQLFPSLSVGRKFNDRHRLQFSYSRRIERPDYEDLNPFRFFRDPFLYYEGNPFLQPELTHSAELGHTFRNTLTTTIDYSYTSNVINWMMGQIDSTNTTFQGPQNLKSFVHYGISFSASQPVVSGWTTNNFLSVFRNEYRGDQHGGNLRNGLTGFTFNSQNTVQLAKHTSAEISLSYYSKSVYGVFVTNPYMVVSAGVQRQVLNKQGTLKLAANDLFQGRKRVQTARYENLDLNTNIRFDSRVITLSFSYRFGNQNLKAGGSRKTGSDEVQSRVKGN